MADLNLDGAGPAVERDFSLLGGVRASRDVWNYPNVHGDITGTTDGYGVKQAATLSYDPFGQALESLPDDASKFDYWDQLGSTQTLTTRRGLLELVASAVLYSRRLPIRPLRRSRRFGEERIILASALIAHPRKRTNAQRLVLSTCKARALRTELRAPYVDEYSCASPNSQERMRDAHSELTNRTELEERLPF